jgi:Family of unknown function (DUF6289)
MTKKRIVGCLLALALLAGIFTLAAPKIAEALPSNQLTITYYSDASQETIVGERTLACTGGWYSWGITTSYRTSDSVPCDLGN